MWKRYREWSRLAYLSPFERRLNRILWSVLIAALLYGWLQHVYLAYVPELFRGGAQLGDLIYDLAIAYVGAFAFYLLVVRLPLRRDRQNHYRHIGWLLWMISQHAKDLMVALNRAARIEPTNRPNTWANVSELCASIGPNSPAPQDQGIQITDTGFEPVSVLYVVMDRMARTEACIEKILSFSSAVPSEIVDLLTAIETYSHFPTVRQIVHLTEQLGGRAGLGTKDFTKWSRQIFDYLLLVDRLDAYAREFGLAQPSQRPAGLIGGSDRVSDEIPLARLMNGNSDGAKSV